MRRRPLRLSVLSCSLLYLDIAADQSARCPTFVEGEKSARSYVDCGQAPQGFSARIHKFDDTSAGRRRQPESPARAATREARIPPAAAVCGGGCDSRRRTRPTSDYLNRGGWRGHTHSLPPPPSGYTRQVRRTHVPANFTGCWISGGKFSLFASRWFTGKDDDGVPRMESAVGWRECI